MAEEKFNNDFYSSKPELWLIVYITVFKYTIRIHNLNITYVLFIN